MRSNEDAENLCEIWIPDRDRNLKEVLVPFGYDGEAIDYLV